MRKIYVDYENVQNNGIEGMERLGRGDTILLFYSEHAENIKIGTMEKFLSTLSNVQIIRCETGTNNALDFQLVARLFMELEKGKKYYIVSNDKGYDSAIRVGVNQEYDIERISDLSALENAEEMEMSLPIESMLMQNYGKKIAEQYGKMIIDGLKKSENKNQFYHYFRIALGENVGGTLYRLIRSKFDEMKQFV